MQSTFQKFFQGPWVERALVFGLILLGVVLRLRQYLAGRSLWLDEAMLALNIVSRDFAGLLGPLDDNQGGPVGFLLAEKLVVTLLGNHELTLRLIPLLAGCASLVLFALLLRKGLAKIGAFTALTLFAVGEPLVYYASEVKQYSSDVFIALLLLWLASKSIIHEAHEENLKSTSFKFLRGKKSMLTLGGIFAVWFSHPALFVLAGVGATLLLDDIIRKDYRRLKQTMLMIALWVVSFAVLYFISLRGLAANAFLREYWTDHFIPMPPWVNLAWFTHTFEYVLIDPTGLHMGTWWPVALALILLGLVALLRHHWRFGAPLVLTLLVTLAASALGLYPFVGRMILFIAPVLLALLGAGVDAPAGGFRRLRWVGNVVSVVIAVFLLYHPLNAAGQYFNTPRYHEHIRPVMAYLREHHNPGDVVYVYHWAVPAFRYYAPFYGFTESDFIAGNNYETIPTALLSEVNQYKGQQRFWVLFSHIYEKGSYNEKDFLLSHLAEIGALKREFHISGMLVYLYLYDLR